MKKILLLIVFFLSIYCAFALGVNENTLEYEEPFILSYPENMKERGLEDVVLPDSPKRVAVLLTKPVRTLHALKVPLIAIPTAGALPWPDDLNVKEFVIPYDKEINIESILLLEPDLVVLGDYQYNTYGQLLSQMGIPVYYVDNSTPFTYENIKNEVLSLADSFDPDGEENRRIMESFALYEERAEDFKKRIEDQRVLIIQQQGNGLSYQTEGGTVGSAFKMLGFNNCYDASSGIGPFSYEKALDGDPDLIVYVGFSNSREENRMMFNEELMSNKEYWNSFDAVKSGKVIILENMHSVVHGVSIFEQQEAILAALKDIGY